jgi:hypothetical protein
MNTRNHLLQWYEVQDYKCSEIISYNGRRGRGGAILYPGLPNGHFARSCHLDSREEVNALFVWLISHQPAVLFFQNKPATSNQPTILFSQNKSAPAISHQTNEQAASLEEKTRSCVFLLFLH